LKLGTVVFLPGAQLVSTVVGTVGDGVSLIDPPPQTGFVSLTTTATSTTDPTSTTTPSPTTSTTPPPTTTTRTTPGHAGAPGRLSENRSQQQQLQALLALLRAETAQLKTKPSSPQPNSPPTSSPGASTTPNTRHTPPSSSPSSSSPGASTTAVLETTSDHLIVTVDLAATSQSEAHAGAPVTVQMPAGNAVRGRITAVSAVATSPSSGGNGGSGSATVPVTITLIRPVHGNRLDRATVSVTFAQSRARHVLSVPVTALIASAGNSYAVQQAAPPHKLIPVTTGLFAAGYVQISGPGIYPGLEVTDSQG
jgi:hypothetical protein